MLIFKSDVSLGNLLAIDSFCLCENFHSSCVKYFDVTQAKVSYHSRKFEFKVFSIVHLNPHNF